DFHDADINVRVPETSTEVGRFRRAYGRSAIVRTPKSLVDGPLAVADLRGVLLVERHVALLAAGEHVERILDVRALPLVAQVDLAALEGGGLLDLVDDPDAQRHRIHPQALGQRLE